MKAWLLAIWTEEAKFVAFIRGCVAMVGALVYFIPGIPEWVSLLILAGSQFISAGDSNPRIVQSDSSRTGPREVMTELSRKG